MLKKFLRVMAGIICIVILVPLAWIASNGVDASEKPWPQSLVVLIDAIPPADNLYDQLVAAPRGTGPTLTMGDCDPSGCANAWAQRRPHWAAQRAPHAAMGAVCERATQSPSLRYQDPLPVEWKPSSPLGEYQTTSVCSTWLLMRALDASHQADPAAALQFLQQAHRLNVAVVRGSRLLVGHIVGVAMHERTLHALMLVAQQHPHLAGDLVALAELPAAEIAAGQRRWMAAEANSMRATVADLAQEASRFSSGISMPNYTTQQFGAHWLQVQGAVDDANPLAVVQAVDALSGPADKGLFGTPWRWRGTVPHILLDVARPAYGPYFGRSANAYLASRSTQLWLQARAQGVAPEQRSAWVAERTQGTPLAGRLVPEPDGSWRLEAVKPTSEPMKAPIIWPT